MGITYLLNVLETVHNERSESFAFKDLIVVESELFDCIQTLDLRQQNERTQVVVAKHQSLQLCELLELGQISMIHNQIKPHVDQVDLLDLFIEF